LNGITNNNMKEYCDTNKLVIDKMVVKLMDRNLFPTNHTLLEPHAGNGNIVKRFTNITKNKFRNQVLGTNVSFCEINMKKATKVHEETGATFLDYDFLKLSTEKKFSSIISVPPFSEWYPHTMKIYEHLDYRGKMVVLLPIEALNNTEFFKWIVSLYAKIEFLKEQSCDYKCDTFILEINKQD